MSTPAPDAGVRAARPSDARAIGRVQARAWASTYRELIDAWTAAITAPPSPDHRVLVATAADRVVGFAALAPSADADAGADRGGPDAELLVLLVDPDDLGRGHGSRLLNATADVLGGPGGAAPVPRGGGRDRAVRRIGRASWSARV